MKLLTIALVLLGSVVALPAAAQGPAWWQRERPSRDYRRDDRREWVYRTPNIEGRFFQTGPRRWKEVNPTGSWYYREEGRTIEYVELYDDSRDLVVRLYSDALYQQAPDVPGWQLAYRGHWR
jgi:hypothetical protein